MIFLPRKERLFLELIRVDMQICKCICIPLDTGKQSGLVEYEDSRCVATPGCSLIYRESFFACGTKIFEIQ